MTFHLCIAMNAILKASIGLWTPLRVNADISHLLKDLRYLKRQHLSDMFSTAMACSSSRWQLEMSLSDGVISFGISKRGFVTSVALEWHFCHSTAAAAWDVDLRMSHCRLRVNQELSGLNWTSSLRILPPYPCTRALVS